MFSKAYGLMFSAPESEKKMHPFFLKVISAYRRNGNKIITADFFMQIAENGAVFNLAQQESMFIFHITCPTAEIFSELRELADKVISDMKLGFDEEVSHAKPQSPQN